MRFYAFLALSRIKYLKHGLYRTKLCAQHYLLYIIVFKWLESKIIVICLKLRVKLRFFEFLNFYGTFARKVAQTWFIFHEIWHTILFGIHCCVEVVRIQNHLHMLEITC